jgi:hypothetical protein
MDQIKIDNVEGELYYEEATYGLDCRSITPLDNLVLNEAGVFIYRYDPKIPDYMRMHYIWMVPLETHRAALRRVVVA